MLARAQGLVHRCVVLPLWMLDKPNRKLEHGDGFQLHTQDDRIKLRHFYEGSRSKALPRNIVVSLCSTWVQRWEMPKASEPVTCIACAAFGNEVFREEHFEIQWLSERKSPL